MLAGAGTLAAGVLTDINDGMLLAGVSVLTDVSDGGMTGVVIETATAAGVLAAIEYGGCIAGVFVDGAVAAEGV